jgi:hypothetical protein
MENRIRKKIIQLVNATHDQKLLEQIYNILDSQNNFTENQLFKNLSSSQKKDTELSLGESEEEYNLEDHNSVMKEIRNKFGWN